MRRCLVAIIPMSWRNSAERLLLPRSRPATGDDAHPERFALRRFHRFRSQLAVLAMLPTVGCMHGSIRVPIRQETYAAIEGKQARCAVVTFPGLLDDLDEFEDEGFVTALRAARVDADVISLDAHYGYYRKGVLLDRVYPDVLRRLEILGYKKIWLLGTSMGGAGALGTAAAFPRRVQGAILLAPYLGDDILEEISQAGGLAAWKPGSEYDPQRYAQHPEGKRAAWQADRRSFFRYLWSWVRERPRGDGSTVAVYIGIGLDDRLSKANHMLAAALPQDNVLTDPGGHDWEVWLRLWKGFLDKGFLQSSCASPAPETPAATLARR